MMRSIQGLSKQKSLWPTLYTVEEDGGGGGALTTGRVCRHRLPIRGKLPLRILSRWALEISLCDGEVSEEGSFACSNSGTLASSETHDPPTTWFSIAHQTLLLIIRDIRGVQGLRDQ
jgi:hypothetical protein